MTSRSTNSILARKRRSPTNALVELKMQRVGKSRRPLVTASSNIFSRIYSLVRKIPRGKVVTYGQIARALGLPRGARTVGWAMHDCPGEVPWHRVVNAQGKISARPTLGFHTQRARLQAEGVRFDREEKIDLKKYGWKRI
jgi:methylated-DNA-protein-cysteine methyltransferase-like protein